MTLADQGNTTIARPGEPDYAYATEVFNLHAPARPDVATTARNVDQVRAALRHAREHGLTVRVHSTGHGAPAARPMTGALLVRTEIGGGVTVDPERGVAHVPAGTRWGEVVAAAAEVGLAAPHGSSADVGVVGYLLRGGISVYGRSVGLGVNSVEAVELVTADGAHLRVDAGHDPELFWALRGGGGGFGVVTSVDVRLFPASPVTTGSAYWPGDLAGPLLNAWRRWAGDAPEAITGSFQVLCLPDLPEVPDAMRARTVVGVTATALGDPAVTGRQLSGLLAPLRVLGKPVFEHWQDCTAAEVVHAQLGPEEPVALVGDHLLLTELSDETAARFLAAADVGPGSPLVSVELRQLGGALSRPYPGGGALDHLDARYAYLGAGIAEGPTTAAAISRHCALVRVALRDSDTGRTAPTFVESVDQPQGHLSPDDIRRADQVRQRVDPSGLFRDEISPGASHLRW